MADGTHNGEFSIVRHEILDDDKFEAVYDDDTLLATWLRLLMAADKAWPSPAPIPWSTNEAAFEQLCVLGLIDRLPHSHYVMHGGTTERSKRRDQVAIAKAKHAANVRWSRARGDAPDA